MTRTNALELALGVGISLLAAAFVMLSPQIHDDYIRVVTKPKIGKLTNMQQNSGGTAFLVNTPSGKTFTLTNAHVCELGKQNGNGDMVLNLNGSVSVQHVIQVYSESDLCLVTAPPHKSGLKVSRFAREGQNVNLTGFPFLQPYTMLKGHISGRMAIQVLVGYDVPCEGTGFKIVPSEGVQAAFGIRFACIRELEANPLDLNSLPGNSGSPVVDDYGDVVGVLFAGGEGRGYMVPLDMIQDFLRDK